jgi:hypothetical protein
MFELHPSRNVQLHLPNFELHLSNRNVQLHQSDFAFIFFFNVELHLSHRNVQLHFIQLAFIYEKIATRSFAPLFKFLPKIESELHIYRVTWTCGGLMGLKPSMAASNLAHESYLFL